MVDEVDLDLEPDPALRSEQWVRNPVAESRSGTFHQWFCSVVPRSESLPMICILKRRASRVSRRPPNQIPRAPNFPAPATSEITPLWLLPLDAMAIPACDATLAPSN